MNSQKPFRGMQLNKTHPLAKGLVGCWLFNEATGGTVFDLSGHDNNGTLENGVVWGSDGLDFDGNNDFVDCGNSNNLDIGTGDFSVDFLMKSTQTGSIFRIIQKRGTGGFGTRGGWQVSRNAGVTGNDWRNTLFDDGAGKYVKISADGNLDNAMDGNFHHLTFIWVGSTNTLTAYIDGINANISTTLVGGDVGSISTSRNCTIGATWDDAVTQSQFFDGSIGSAFIHNRALSAEEVAWSHREPYTMFEQKRTLGIFSIITFVSKLVESLNDIFVPDNIQNLNDILLSKPNEALFDILLSKEGQGINDIILGLTIQGKDDVYIGELVQNLNDILIPTLNQNLNDIYLSKINEVPYDISISKIVQEVNDILLSKIVAGVYDIIESDVIAKTIEALSDIHIKDINQAVNDILLAKTNQAVSDILIPITINGTNDIQINAPLLQALFDILLSKEGKALYDVGIKIKISMVLGDNSIISMVLEDR